MSLYTDYLKDLGINLVSKQIILISLAGVNILRKFLINENKTLLLLLSSFGGYKILHYSMFFDFVVIVVFVVISVAAFVLLV